MQRQMKIAITDEKMQGRKKQYLHAIIDEKMQGQTNRYLFVRIVTNYIVHEKVIIFSGGVLDILTN
jgi:hypothetical protein